MVSICPVRVVAILSVFFVFKLLVSVYCSNDTKEYSAFCSDMIKVEIG